jgi:hypothetical protein
MTDTTVLARLDRITAELRALNATMTRLVDALERAVPVLKNLGPPTIGLRQQRVDPVPPKDRPTDWPRL